MLAGVRGVSRRAGHRAGLLQFWRYGFKALRYGM